MGTSHTQRSHANEGDSTQEQPGSHAHHTHHDEPMTPEEAVRSLLLLGQVALDAGDYESASQAYASLLKIEPNETACYNLGSLHARGLGARRDLVEGARLFHQAELLGNGQAGKLCAKCMFDYVNETIEGKRPADLYATMALFASRVYPEATDQGLEASRGLLAIGVTYLNQEEYAKAAKVLRAAAEFGDDGYAQYYLAMLYNAGAGLQKDDLAALFWLDCAVDNGATELALKDRDGILDACRQGLSAAEFRDTMARLADWCSMGTPDVPANPVKAMRWRELAR